MLKRSAKSFLRRFPPFAQFDDHALSQLVQGLTLEFYPAGTHILRQGDRSPGSLHIIKEGSVRISACPMQGRETVIDFRGTGDTFGPLPLAGDQPMDISAQAVSDTVCYVADRASVVRLRDEHPALTEDLIPPYFLKSADTASRFRSGGGVLRYGPENALFTTPVRELASRDLITSLPDVPIRDAVHSMSVHGADALVIVDADDRPVGMFTLADLRDRVLAAQRSLLDPVGDVSTATIVNVDGADLCFEALLKMMGHDVHHLLVMDAGRLAGIVSNHDFMLLQGTAPLMIVKDIEMQASVEGLSALSGKVTALISLLLGEGARAVSIHRIITTVNDRIERKVLDLAERTLGPPPVPYCWIVYGSAGRKEQTFITDQDNGVICADAGEGASAGDAHAYFTRFADFAVNAFRRCGYELCPGDFMATNPRWCQPYSAWRSSFQNWIRTPTDEAIHYAVNLFDFRGLHGDLRLASDLRAHLGRSLRDQHIFLKAVAGLAVDYRPPLGLFGTLRMERDGVHANQLDLKKHCLTPLINIIRLFSFECGLAEVSTMERLAELRAVHPVVKTLGGDLEYAWEFLSLLRIRHQLEQIAGERAPDNFINPKDLSSLEQRNLKEICRMLSRMLDDIEKKYGIGTRL